MISSILVLASGETTAGFLGGVMLATPVGAALCWLILSRRAAADAASRKAEGERLIEEARRKRDELLAQADADAKKKFIETMERFERETAETREELRNLERRLAKREDLHDKKLEVLSSKERKIEEGEQRVARQSAELDQKHQKLDATLAEQREVLLRIGNLTPEEARRQCLARIESEVEREAGRIVERTLTDATERARERAREITIDAIQRFAAEHTCEATVATVDVASDDMKGRIIGREGRNIRAFEKITGVTVIVDDTPGVVSISVFDPVRKEVARLALERLVKDGRIHPTRIEELVNETTAEVNTRIAEAGKSAALEANVSGLQRKVVETLGRLVFRTSYGQNVLRHSVEVAHLCGIMADELRLDGALARRCGLLHDIGKALDHDLPGSHTKIGFDFCKRFNESATVLNAIEGHHGDVASETVYTPLVMAADAVSASRPGGRRESLERYIKRLEELEAIATDFPGVRQAFAIEAGREVRVVVDAVRVDDRSALKLARDIANQIEERMTYPGEIKVTVLREIRATEYAR